VRALALELTSWSHDDIFGVVSVLAFYLLCIAFLFKDTSHNSWIHK
jgi:hypothetical protein